MPKRAPKSITPDLFTRHNRAKYSNHLEYLDGNVYEVPDWDGTSKAAHGFYQAMKNWAARNGVPGKASYRVIGDKAYFCFFPLEES